MRFSPYPFERLALLLPGTTGGRARLDLSIGEPAFGAPSEVVDSVCKNSGLISHYPKSRPMECLTESQLSFVKDRFGVNLGGSQLVSTFGTREVLFNLPQFILSSKTDPVVSFCNPFYQIYEGAQIASGSRVFYMPINRENNFTPHLNTSQLEQVDLVILNSPNNPTGRTLSIDELKNWVELCLEYDFVLLNDECYSDIYVDSKPSSVLQASLEVGNTSFKNVLSVNSISKRLSCPGLRSGFVAGDERILSEYMVYRSYLGVSIPMTLQPASALAWGNSVYAEEVRLSFARNMQLAIDVFGSDYVFPYTFYLWLYVGNFSIGSALYPHLSRDELFTLELNNRFGITVLPGSYMGRDGCGVGYVRVALTKEFDVIKEALGSIKSLLRL